MFHFLLLCVLSLAHVLAASESAPNIVILLADDLGWRDLGCQGSRYYETPHIDRLAAQSLRFSHAYAAAPVCLPTRAALLTGKSPARLHMTCVFDRNDGSGPLLPTPFVNRLPHAEETLAERLRAHGYATAFIGKWHLGIEEEYWPEQHGFQVNIGGWKAGKPARYFPPYENPRLSDGPPEEYLTDRLASEAASYIRNQDRDRPFFLEMSFYSPHTPLEAPAETIDRFRDRAPDGGQANPVYAAMVAHLDAAVGRILQALDDTGLADNTIVVFTSDNGDVYSIWDTRITDNAPLRGEKFQLYEGGIRVPCCIRWPGRIATDDSPQAFITQDLLPTLLGLLGAPPADQAQLDGLDLSAVLLGEREPLPRDLAWHYPHHMPRQDMRPAAALRRGQYKLIEWYEDGALELYDLSQDPGEQHNLIASQAAQAAELQQALQAWREQVGANMPPRR